MRINYRDLVNESENCNAVERNMEENYKEISDKIRGYLVDARRSRNMTQRTLSQITKVSQGDISKLENCVANPSLRTLQRIALGLGLRMDITFEPIKAEKKEKRYY